MRKRLVVVGVGIIAGLLASTGVRGLCQAAKEHHALPNWIRSGDDIRPMPNMQDGAKGHACSVRTIAGQWVWRYAGKDDTGVDILGVGTLTIEANGNDSFYGWFTWGPDVIEGVATGTVEVNPDCTGTQTWFGDPPGIYDVAIAHSGGEIWFKSRPPEPLGLTTAERVNDPF